MNYVGSFCGWNGDFVSSSGGGLELRAVWGFSELSALSVATHSESGAQDPRRVAALIGWFLGSEAERSAACASRQLGGGQVSQGHPDYYRKRSGAATKIRALLNGRRRGQQDTRSEQFSIIRSR